jgi:hypothetical protein
VGVTWYDRREHPDGTGYSVRFSASLDGGETWSPSVPVSEVASLVGGKEKAATAGNLLGPQYSGTAQVISLSIGREEDFRGGDTAGLVSDAKGGFHALWIDNRTGIHQMWTAVITVAGKAVQNGSPDLADLDDVTSKVALEVVDSSYDEANQQAQLTVCLKNISNSKLGAPLKIRAVDWQSLLTGLKPGLGEPQAINADNHQSGTGAVWDFSSLVPADGLPPGARSGEKQLRFRLLHVRHYEKAAADWRDPSKMQFTLGLVSLQVRVLGRAANVGPPK